MFDIVRIKFAIDYKLTGLPTATTFHSAKNLVHFLLNKHELDHLILVRFCWHFCNGTCYSTSLPSCSYFDKGTPPLWMKEHWQNKQCTWAMYHLYNVPRTVPRGLWETTDGVNHMQDILARHALHTVSASKTWIEPESGLDRQEKLYCRDVKCVFTRKALRSGTFLSGDGLKICLGFAPALFDQKIQLETE